MQGNDAEKARQVGRDQATFEPWMPIHLREYARMARERGEIIQALDLLKVADEVEKVAR